MFISRPAVNDIEKQLPLPHMLMTDRERHLPPPPRPSPVMRPRSCAEIVVGNEPIPKALENWINHDSYALTLPIRDDFYSQPDNLTMEDEYGGPVIVDSYQDIQDFFCAWDSDRVKDYLTFFGCVIGITIIIYVVKRLPD